MFWPNSKVCSPYKMDKTYWTYSLSHVEIHTNKKKVLYRKWTWKFVDRTWMLLCPYSDCTVPGGGSDRRSVRRYLKSIYICFYICFYIIIYICILLGTCTKLATLKGHFTKYWRHVSVLPYLFLAMIFNRLR